MGRRYVAALALAVLLGCGTGDEDTGDEILGHVAQDALIIDVRAAAEFETGHIEGAVNIPHDEIGARIGDVTEDLDRKIIVYCRSGSRAAQAKITLEGLGYTNVENAGTYNDLRARLQES